MSGEIFFNSNSRFLKIISYWSIVDSQCCVSAVLDYFLIIDCKGIFFLKEYINLYSLKCQAHKGKQTNKNDFPLKSS